MHSVMKYIGQFLVILWGVDDRVIRVVVIESHDPHQCGFESRH